MNPHRKMSPWHYLAVPALSEVLTEGILFGVEEIPGPALRLCYAASTVLVGYLIYPAYHGRRNIPPDSLLFWSIVTAGSFLFLAITRSGIPADPLPLLSLALGTAVLTLFLSNTTLYLSLLLGDALRAQRTISTAILLTATAPLWMAPLAEQLPAISSTIVNISPLTYLAVISDYDFLRSAWFYRHTPLGGLRYTYLTPYLFTGIYLAMTLTLTLAHRTLLKLKHRHHASDHEEPMSFCEENTQ